MSKPLEPAHEVLVESIKVKGKEHVDLIRVLESGEEPKMAGGKLTIPFHDLIMAKHMALGAFCALL